MKQTQNKIFGIIGESLIFSLSPYIHNRLFKKNSLGYFYTKFELDKKELVDAIKSIKTFGFGGINVTYPYKETIIPLLDTLDQTASLTGAVNLVKNIKGKLKGYNTDLIGIRQTIKERIKIDLKGSSVLLLGSGGAARAALYELIKIKVGEVIILNRNNTRAKKMLSSLKAKNNISKINITISKEIKSIKPDKNLSLMINGTSAGVAYLRRIIKSLSVKDYFDKTVIFDMNYGDRALKSSKKIGQYRYYDGLFMLSAQAAESFRLWTNIIVDPIDIYNDLFRNLNKDNT